PAGHQPAPLSPIATLTGHAGTVTAVVFSADGASLFSGGVDRPVRRWDVAARREVLRFGDARHEVGCVAWSPAGHVLAGQGVSVRAYAPARGRELLRLAGHPDAVRAVAVSADGHRAVSGGDDRTVRVWDLPGGREVHRLARHRAGVTGVALSPDGR